jgi:nucleoid DNA-binding protein
MTPEKFREHKNIVVAKIIDDLQKEGRSIVRGLGTFRVVKHKAKVNNLGKIPARKLVKFSMTIELRNKVNK